MNKPLKPLCIIPARAGSKRLTSKNKIVFDGKTLIEWAIEVAIESQLFLHIFPSSDDEEILEIAYNHFNQGLVQPHRRPIRMARDDISLREVCRFVLMTYKVQADAFCLLIPNNPFRTAKELQDAYKLFRKKDANYLISVKRFTPPPQMALSIKDGFLKPYGTEFNKQSQELEPLYVEDGSFAFAKIETFFNEFDMNFYGSKCLPYIINRPSIDIDTPEDLAYAEYLRK